MGTTKAHLFTDTQNQLARMAKALGHPARIAILQALIQKGSCVCGTLVEDVGLKQATTSQHLKALKEAGLIHGEVEGTRVCYCINLTVCKKAMEDLNNLFCPPGCCE